MEKFLSIIIPVYNVEKYLAECLDSCLEQDIPHDDYEIICVNDGSTDGSAEILERYAREHSNVRVITQPNGGISAARNTGLDAAVGEYIWFVDSDDFIRKNCLAYLRRAVTETTADKHQFGYCGVNDVPAALSQAEADRDTLSPGTLMNGVVAWDALYRHAFLRQHGLRFQTELRYSEDGFFQRQLRQHSPVIVTHQAVLYFYRRNPNSLTRSVSPEVIRVRRDTIFAYQKLLRQCQADHREYASVIMPLVRQVVIPTAALPAEERRKSIRELSDAGLFPLFLYRNIEDCFPQKVHMNHNNMGLRGKLLDILFFYSTTRLGFAALVLFYKLYNKKHRRDY